MEQRNKYSIKQQKKANVSAWKWVIIAIINIILLLQLGQGFYNTFKLKRLHDARLVDTVQRYAILVEKKNELDTVTSEAYADTLLRENLQLYKKGEKLVILEGTPDIQVNLDTKETRVKPWSSWKQLFLYGLLNN